MQHETKIAERLSALTARLAEAKIALVQAPDQFKRPDGSAFTTPVLRLELERCVDRISTFATAGPGDLRRQLLAGLRLLRDVEFSVDDGIVVFARFSALRDEIVRLEAAANETGYPLEVDSGAAAAAALEPRSSLAPQIASLDRDISDFEATLELLRNNASVESEDSDDQMVTKIFLSAVEPQITDAREMLSQSRIDVLGAVGAVEALSRITRRYCNTLRFGDQSPKSGGFAASIQAIRAKAHATSRSARDLMQRSGARRNGLTNEGAVVDYGFEIDMVAANSWVLETREARNDDGTTNPWNEQPQLQSAVLSGSVLVVDDIATNRNLLADKLRSELVSVTVAVDGVDAIERAVADDPDLILMDIMMPRMNGVEACRALKNDPRTDHIPIVLVTALNEREDRLRGLWAGADDFLNKPVNDVQLLTRVRATTKLKRSLDDLRNLATPGELYAIKELAAEARILIVDENERSARRVCRYLEQDHKVTPYTGTGSLTPGSRFDMVIVSFVGDSLRSLMLCAYWRSRKATRDLPIMAIVDPNSERWGLRALDLGASDIVVMPLDSEELQARVRTQLRRKRYLDALRHYLRSDT